MVLSLHILVILMSLIAIKIIQIEKSLWTRSFEVLNLLVLHTIVFVTTCVNVSSHNFFSTNHYFTYFFFVSLSALHWKSCCIHWYIYAIAQPQLFLRFTALIWRANKRRAPYQLKIQNIKVLHCQKSLIFLKSSAVRPFSILLRFRSSVIALILLGGNLTF